jgi:PAS domain S-box-containing protein
MLRAFSQSEYNLDVFDSAKAVLNVIGEKEFDVGLIDLNLPEMNGIELVKELRSKNILTELIIVTGAGSIADAIEAMKLGCYDYIFKPFGIDELKIVIHKAYEKKAINKENRLLKEQLRLKESEERFQAIFDNARDGILIADIVNKKLHLGNKTMCQMLGYSLEEIKNLDIGNIHPKEHLPYVLDQFDKLVKGEVKLTKDIPTQRKDGSIFYSEINGSLMVMEGKSYLMGIFRDITERKQIEEELQKAKDKLIAQQSRALLELSTPVIRVWDEILVLPLIGPIDAARAEQIIEQLLTSISSNRAVVAIIDITGVHTVDTNVADHLLKTIHASRMLGCECILTGVGPYNAQTLTKLGVDLSSIITKGTLETGLRLAFDRTKNKVSKENR